MSWVYCKAVLRHDQRIKLDGAPAEPIGEQAIDLATKAAGAARRTQGSEESKEFGDRAVRLSKGTRLHEGERL